ncbi:MAG: hypothetical protein HYV63_26655 [Candidatus Schekmanbacteria bacterium]|nr:hypothetical protein [Candidatus Schekmanbacteria bacterium]
MKKTRSQGIMLATAMSLLASLGGGIAPVAAEGSGSKAAMAAEATVTGTLVDTKCYSMNAMNSGNDHMTPNGEVKGCAATCAGMGIPVGLVDDAGHLHVVIAPASLFAPHMTKTARVTGMVAPDGAGIVASKAEVKEGESWVEVKLATMM